MGRDVRTDIPPDESEVFTALKTNLPVLYEYMLNKYPEKFPVGTEITFEEKNARGKSTGKVLGKINTLTTNYLGEKARVENVIPKMDELPKPVAPEPKVEVSETGAVSGVPLAAGAGGGGGADVGPAVKTDTGAVAPELTEPVREAGEELNAYNQRWRVYIGQLHSQAVQKMKVYKHELDFDEFYFLYRDSPENQKERKTKFLKPLQDEIIDTYYKTSYYGMNYNSTTQPKPLKELMRPFKSFSLLDIDNLARAQGFQPLQTASADATIKHWDAILKRVSREVREPYTGGYFSYEAKYLLNNRSFYNLLMDWQNMVYPYVKGFNQYLVAIQRLVNKESFAKIKDFNTRFADVHLRNLYVFALNSI